ncbi:hypothetical protein QBC42DRAFT_231085 [Cladorrhinum samala]|uniref:Uncharacterized protein n=1 Tax=Cladorrhinum samala TaxID=585594 RepID=A0AAV9HHU7_9PEZI|nr:hypothetical protein QBC42DRAFT_231085 [Cladorrhinum samala]
MSSSNPASTPAETPSTKKKSLYQRYWEYKNHRTKQISDEDMLKYTGKSRAELGEWSKSAPGVGGNQAAGTLAAGPASGFGGMAAAEGLGGWGFGAKGKLKYPNGGGAADKKAPQAKEVDDDDSD